MGDVIKLQIRDVNPVTENFRNGNGDKIFVEGVSHIEVTSSIKDNTDLPVILDTYVGNAVSTMDAPAVAIEKKPKIQTLDGAGGGELPLYYGCRYYCTKGNEPNVTKRETNYVRLSRYTGISNGGDGVAVQVYRCSPSSSQQNTSKLILRNDGLTTSSEPTIQPDDNGECLLISGRVYVNFIKYNDSRVLNKITVKFLYRESGTQQWSLLTSKQEEVITQAGQTEHPSECVDYEYVTNNILNRAKDYEVKVEITDTISNYSYEGELDNYTKVASPIIELAPDSTSIGIGVYPNNKRNNILDIEYTTNFYRPVNFLGNNIHNINLDDGKHSWADMMMGKDGKKIEFPEQAVNNCLMGVSLVFCPIHYDDYSYSLPSSNYHSFFIPKFAIMNDNSERGVGYEFWLNSGSEWKEMYIYVSKTGLTGHNSNNPFQVGTGYGRYWGLLYVSII